VVVFFKYQLYDNINTFTPVLIDTAVEPFVVFSVTENKTFLPDVIYVPSIAVDAINLSYVVGDPPVGPVPDVCVPEFVLCSTKRTKC